MRARPKGSLAGKGTREPPPPEEQPMLVEEPQPDGEGSLPVEGEDGEGSLPVEEEGAADSRPEEPAPQPGGDEPAAVEPQGAAELAPGEPEPPPDEEQEPPFEDVAIGPPTPQPELYYDPTFARRAALALAAVFVLLSWPLWILAFRIVARGDVLGRFSASIGLTLVLVAIALALGALYLGLLELRAKAKLIETAPAPTVATRGFPAADAIKSLPDILKAFGQLPNVAALLIVATALFVCGMVLAWHLGSPAS